MCTLIAAFQQYPGYPLVVAANRDERLTRPATPPRRWPGEPFVAPRDEVGGGTWLGLNREGMFVGVTNRFGATLDDGRPSRGQLVVEALRQPSAWVLHQQLSALSVHRFNPFHLLYADREHAFVTWSDGTSLRQQRLEPGVHIVTERSLGGDDKARTERIRSGWQRLGGARPDPAQLQALLSQHAASDPLGASCVHLPALGYGTRSSLVLYLSETLEDSRWLWAEGPPCQTPFTEGEQLLHSLR